jgi:hypothetical protein
MSDILALSKDFLFAREKYERAVRSLVRSEPVMEDKPKFWKMVEEFRRLVLTHRRAGIKLACEEFVRKAFVEARWEFSEDDLPGFIRTYGRLKESLDRALVGAYGSRGDGFKDLIDSLPLAGQSACLRLLAGEAKHYDGILNIVDEECSETVGLNNIVMLGENYVEQTLEDAYSDKLCVMLTREDKEFTKLLESGG